MNGSTSPVARSSASYAARSLWTASASHVNRMVESPSASSIKWRAKKNSSGKLINSSSASMTIAWHMLVTAGSTAGTARVRAPGSRTTGSRPSNLSARSRLHRASRSESRSVLVILTETMALLPFFSRIQVRPHSVQQQRDRSAMQAERVACRRTPRTALKGNDGTRLTSPGRQWFRESKTEGCRSGACPDVPQGATVVRTMGLGKATGASSSKMLPIRSCIFGPIFPLACLFPTRSSLVPWPSG
jgi:hypothetical protein